MLFDIYDQKQARREEQEAEGYCLNKNSQFSAQFSNLNNPEIQNFLTEEMTVCKSVPPQQVHTVLSALILPHRDL